MKPILLPEAHPVLAHPCLSEGAAHTPLPTPAHLQLTQESLREKKEAKVNLAGRSERCPQTWLPVKSMLFS